MAKQITLHQCAYCEYTLKTEKGILIHENTCKHNPTVIEATRIKATSELAIEEIRTTAKSIPELFERLIAYLQTIDIELSFTNYPSIWSDCVSNGHNAPIGYKTNWCGIADVHGIPRGYPGWRGGWAGTIKYISKTTPLALYDVTGSRFNQQLVIPFIHIGSGSSGSKFSIDGMLFLYDFPAMHNEWKMNGDEYDLLGTQFSDNLRELDRAYRANKNHWIDRQKDMLALADAYEEIQELINLRNSLVSKTTAYYANAYKATYPFEIPDIPSTFINLPEYKASQNLQVIEHIDKPDVTSLYERTAALAAELAEYKSKYAEYFI